MSGVIRQKTRSESQLKREGFQQFPRKKEIVMARELPAKEAPLKIHTEWAGTIVATAGYMICYDTVGQEYQDASKYHHWPVEPSIFEKTYQAWDEAFQPTPAQKMLMDIGCKPYYKAVGVWAKSLDEDVYIQSIEHEKPVLIPEERVLAIGADGEPYAMGDETFHDRYDGTLTKKPNPLKRAAEKLIKFFKGDF